MRPPEPITASSTNWTSPILRLLARPFQARGSTKPIVPIEPMAPEAVIDPAQVPISAEESLSPPPVPPKRKRETVRKKRKPIPEPAPATWILVAPNRYIRAEEPPVAPDLPETSPIQEESPISEVESPPIISAETSDPL